MRFACPVWLRAAAAYAVLTIAFAWPLPVHLGDRLTGQVSGDTGVYVWNLWSFQHELSRGESPFFSTALLTPSPRVDLSLHNYTPVLNLVALPLLAVVTLVTAFNLVYLLTAVFAAFSAFALVRRLVSDAWVAWLAGAAFAFSPFFVARSTGHFSLVAVAPLPLFVLALIRLEETRQTRWAVGAGGLLAVALYSDPYYAVYCLMLAATLALARVARVAWRPSRLQPWVGYVVDGAAVGVGALAVSIVLTGGYTLQVGPLRVGLNTLYTPMLVLVLIALVRAWLTLGPRVALRFDASQLLRLRVAIGIAVTAALVASPWLYALGHRLAEGGNVSERIFWRTSPRGLDLLSVVIPGPMHPLGRDLFAGWFAGQPGLAIENVASLPLVVLGVIVVAFWRYRARAPVFWWVVTVGSVLLSLGPFIHIGGVNSYVPGPWAFLRYVPFVSSARMPTRFAAVTALGLAVLFAYALSHVAGAHQRRRRLLLGATSALLLFELLPAPRVLYSAKVPAVYQIIAADTRDVAVMNLPLGMRDGVRSYGSYNTARQFYQAFHRKRIVGGYISRLPASLVERQRRFPVITTLLALSEGQDVESVPFAQTLGDGDRFVERARLGYVVVNRQRTPPAALEYARRALQLEPVAESDGLALYRPRPGPSGQPPDR
ncbi:MAG: hypothetical protein AB1806_05320 [Acidobacteriota bacterium]